MLSDKEKDSEIFTNTNNATTTITNNNNNINNIADNGGSKSHHVAAHQLNQFAYTQSMDWYRDYLR